jgi:hypothetical protein
MSDPLFESRTPRLDLPLLFAGQAQKEFYLNESLSRLDALLHCAVEAVANDPPPAPESGQCWLVGPTPTGSWHNRAGCVACFSQGQWLFQAPRDGLRLFNRATGLDWRYAGSWRSAARPPALAGGAVVDTELRAAFAALLDSLSGAGILPRQEP